MSENAKIRQEEVLSDGQYTLKKVTFSFLKKDGQWQDKTHEIYDTGNATTVLLYNKEQKTVVLTRQFRLPSFLNGNKDGKLVETCAGKLDEEAPEEGIKREIEEETGYKVKSVHKVFEAYMSPASVKELIHYFIATYDASMKEGEGGGLKEEGEDVEVLEMPFAEAVEMLNNGTIKDAKTIILLQYALLKKLIDD